MLGLVLLLGEDGSENDLGQLIRWKVGEDCQLCASFDEEAEP